MMATQATQQELGPGVEQMKNEKMQKIRGMIERLEIFLLRSFMPAQCCFFRLNVVSILLQ